MLVGQEVRVQLGPEHLHVGVGVVEVVGPDVPQRHQLVVLRALVVRRHAAAEAERPLHRLSAQRRSRDTHHRH